MKKLFLAALTFVTFEVQAQNSVVSLANIQLSPLTLPVTRYISNDFPELAPSIGCEIRVDLEYNAIWFNVVSGPGASDINFGTSVYSLPALPIQEGYQSQIRIYTYPQLNIRTQYENGILTQEVSQTSTNENGDSLYIQGRLRLKVSQDLSTFEEGSYEEFQQLSGQHLEQTTLIECSNQQSQPLS